MELQASKMKTKGLEIEGNGAKVTIYGGESEKVRSLPTWEAGLHLMVN